MNLPPKCPPQVLAWASSSAISILDCLRHLRKRPLNDLLYRTFARIMYLDAIFHVRAWVFLVVGSRKVPYFKQLNIISYHSLELSVSVDDTSLLSSSIDGLGIIWTLNVKSMRESWRGTREVVLSIAFVCWLSFRGMLSTIDDSKLSNSVIVICLYQKILSYFASYAPFICLIIKRESPNIEMCLNFNTNAAHIPAIKAS